MTRDRLLRRILEFRSFSQGRWRAGLLLVALALFVGGGLLAWSRLPEAVGPVRPGLLWIVALVGVPVTALLTASEYWLSTSLAGAPMRFREAFLVSVGGTAMNMLPIPGAFAVRIQAMKARGTSYGMASSVTIGVGLVWLGLASVGAGVALLPSYAAGPFVAAGVGALSVALVVISRRGRPRRWVWLTVTIAAIEIASIAADAARLYLTLTAMGFGASLEQVLVFAFSVVAASASGVFPGGLGLREWIASALAPLVGVASSVGFLVTAVNRLVGTVVHVPVVLGLLIAGRRKGDGLASG